jgi:hypothetical protein
MEVVKGSFKRQASEKVSWLKKIRCVWVFALYELCNAYIRREGTGVIITIRSGVKLDNMKSDNMKSDNTKSYNIKSDNTKLDNKKLDNTKSDNIKLDDTKPDNTKSDNMKSDNMILYKCKNLHCSW